MDLIQKKCPQCNVIFSSSKQDKIYCSSNCRKIYNRTLTYTYINTCPVCNVQKTHTRQNTYLPSRSKLGNSKCNSCRQKGKVVKERIDYSKYSFYQSDDIFIRTCPNCSDILTYKKKYYAYSACKKDSKCISCSVKGHNNGKVRYAFKKYSVSSIEELDALLPEKELYYKNVWRYTYKQPLNCLENYRPERKNGYAIDHIYPISWGFKNKVPYELIGDISNLQMLPFRENESKSDKITIIPDNIKKYLDM
jgi:hypothetical protein